MSDKMTRWPLFRVALYRRGIGVRIRRHYWHLRRDPVGLLSERMGWNCRYWDCGRWRLTHRWNWITESGE